MAAQTILAQNAIEVDTDQSNSDLDSLYTSEDYESITDTLASKLRDFKYEHGRRYHAYKEGSWPFPNDEIQQDQMDLNHEIYSLPIEGELHLAPIAEKPQRVLDCGTGTGIWAIQFADKYPSAEVIGNDLSPIQPTWVPPNCSFEVDDFNGEWSYKPESFDFVHSRALHGGVENWENFLASAFRVLKPGGWYESLEHAVELITDDDSLDPNSAMGKWPVQLVDGLEKINKTAVVSPKLEKWLSEAGFDPATIKQEVFKLPVGTWPKDKAMKQLGAMNLVNVLMAAEGWTMAVYTRVLGYTEEETKRELEFIKRQLKDKKTHSYFRMYVTYAQKPIAAATG